MTIELHCFGESGASYKAALPMELAGLDWRPVFLDFFNGAARSETFRRDLNEMGEAPVMIETETGYRLTQSGAIQDYISEQTGRFNGADTRERREILRWVLWDNHKLSGYVGPTRFMMNFLPEDKRPDEAIAWLRGRLKASYAILETHLAGRDWLVGRNVTNADFSCCGYLFYDEPFGFDRTAHPNIDRWLDRIASLPGWRHPYELMPGNPGDRT